MISSPTSSDISNLLLSNEFQDAKNKVLKWKKVFDDRYYMSVQRTGRNLDESLLNLVIDLGVDMQVPIVAMNDVQFLNKTDFGGEGYFAEVFIKFANIEYDRNTYFYDAMPNEPYLTSEEIKAWDIAPGVGVGRKWVNKKGWTFEYMLGLGRYLFANSENDDVPDGGSVSDYRPEATFKGGISIGKRF